MRPTARGKTLHDSSICVFDFVAVNYMYSRLQKCWKVCLTSNWTWDLWLVTCLVFSISHESRKRHVVLDESSSELARCPCGALESRSVHPVVSTVMVICSVDEAMIFVEKEILDKYHEILVDSKDCCFLRMFLGIRAVYIKVLVHHCHWHVALFRKIGNLLEHWGNPFQSPWIHEWTAKITMI